MVGFHVLEVYVLCLRVLADLLTDRRLRLDLFGRRLLLLAMKSAVALTTRSRR